MCERSADTSDPRGFNVPAVSNAGRPYVLIFHLRPLVGEFFIVSPDGILMRAYLRFKGTDYSRVPNEEVQTRFNKNLAYWTTNFSRLKKTLEAEQPGHTTCARLMPFPKIIITSKRSMSALGCVGFTSDLVVGVLGGQRRQCADERRRRRQYPGLDLARFRQRRRTPTTVADRASQRHGRITVCANYQFCPHRSCEQQYHGT